MYYKPWRPKITAKPVPAWEVAQRRILKEDRDGDPAFVRAIQAMQVAPRKVRGA